MPATSMSSIRRVPLPNRGSVPAQDAAFVAEVRRQNLTLLGFRDIRDRLRKEGAL
jgi:hypothetical protein